MRVGMALRFESGGLLGETLPFAGEGAQLAQGGRGCQAGKARSKPKRQSRRASSSSVLLFYSVLWAKCLTLFGSKTLKAKVLSAKK